MALEPIALIGISCEFAGGIDRPEALWTVLKDSVDVGSEIPHERFDMDSFAPLYDAKKPYIRRGYFLSNDRLDHFDPSFFGINDGDALSMDPCHRLLLQKFVHLLEDADYPLEKIQGSRTAVFIGQFTTDHSTTLHREKIEHHTHHLGANISLFNASARLSYHFDLRGPNLTLDTACSSSLQAVQLAVQSLRTGEVNLAVAGASNLNYTPEAFFMSMIVGAVSPDGRSRSYSDDANGYAKSDGVGLLLLKRLTDAIRDKDRIYCVLRDVITSHDGREGKTGYNVPSGEGQMRLLNEIYTRSGTDKDSVFYIEGHGTGTQVGDPIEANALGAFFSRSSYDSPLLIGSVKSVIGHTEATAGIASLIKTALCLKHRSITPNMHFNRINPKIQARKYNLHIVTHLTRFPDHPITVGVNSFSFGGNIVHAILTEWRQEQPLQTTVSTNRQQRFILPFSAKCPVSLRNQLTKFSEWFSNVPLSIIERDASMFFSALSTKLMLKRTTSFSHRLSLIFSSREELHEQLRSYLIDQHSSCPGVILPREERLISSEVNFNICFIYSGQGPQWWAMGRELFFHESIFRQWIERLDEEFLLVSDGCFHLIDELIKPSREEHSHINQTNVAQPAILAIQIALTSLWTSWGIRPTHIVGHSVGEVAAAFIAGRLTLRETVQIIYHRSRVQNYNSNQGGRMLAVFINEEEAKMLIEPFKDDVQIAAINNPKSVTLSGDGDVLQLIYDELCRHQSKVFKSWLKINNAFHSRQMERFNIREELLQSLINIKGIRHSATNQQFDLQCPQANLYSTVTGTRADQCVFDREYWWKNIRDTVLFNQTMKCILEDMTIDNGLPIFIELSPHPVLSTTIPECWTQFEQTHASCQSPFVIHSLKRKEDEQQTILSSFCQLYTTFGTNLVDWNRLSNSITIEFERFPLYSFNEQICWSELKDSVVTRRALRRKSHPLLGYRQWSNEARTPTWKNLIRLDQSSSQLSFLLDHQVQGSILLPASGFIELILAAINELLLSSQSHSSSITLRNIQFLQGLRLSEETSVQLETVIVMPMKEFFIYSRQRHINEAVRLSGMSGNDLSVTFIDETSLHSYSMKEWTLNCRGSIHLNFDGTLINSMFSIESILQRFSSTKDTICVIDENDPKSREYVYKYLEGCGLSYGKQFRCLKSMKRREFQVLAEINLLPSIVKDEKTYASHPVVLDNCFQALAGLIPGKFDEMGLPMSIDELIFFNRNESLVSMEKIFCLHSLNPSIKGLYLEKCFQTDILIFNPSNIPKIIIRGFQVQIRRDPALNNSLFDNIISSASTLNTNPKRIVPTDRMIEQFCAQPAWKLTQLIENPINNDDEGFWLIITDRDIGELQMKHEIIDVSLTRQQIHDVLNTRRYPNILFVCPLNPISFEEFGCASLMFLIQSIYQMKYSPSPHLVILTHNAQTFAREHFNLLQSPIVGFARSLINEYAHGQMKLIDLHSPSSTFSTELRRALINEMNDMNDDEVILSFNEETRSVQRYLPTYEMLRSLRDEMKTSTIIPSETVERFQLELPKSRRFVDLKWIHHSSRRSRQLTSNQVEIHVHCTSITSRDLLKFKGLYPFTRSAETTNNDDLDTFVGMEFSGVIVNKGDQIDRFHLGDRVFGLVTRQSAFQSHLIVDENQIARAPSTLTMEECATLPSHIVAIYALDHCARVRRGQTVLIHSAAGATGLACIQYCQSIGVKIIATAATEEKRAFLRETYQLTDVFNSQDLSFIPQINGQIDVIINSLSGIFLSESAKLLSPLGHFIELGKQDLFNKTQLPLFFFRASSKFHVVDLVTLQQYSPQTIANILQEISSRYEKGILRPISPLRVFEPSKIDEALSIYSLGLHQGKFVIRIGESCQRLLVESNVTREEHGNLFSESVCDQGTIVISGGLGGLSTEMSKWMIKEHRVKRIVLLSRRNIDQIDRDSSQYHDWTTLQRLAKENNAFVTTKQVDVTQFDQLFEVLRQITDYPIRGVIHSAMVLHDGLLTNMTQETLSKVMKPKICGAWNLHRATEMLSSPLRFFLMFSSIRNHITDIGQSNYNAGNNYLDALAHWRLHCRGLPALSISLPAISGAGYLHHHTKSVVDQMKEQGVQLLPALDVFRLIEHLDRLQRQSTMNKFATPVMFVVDWRMLLKMNLSTKLIDLAKAYLKNDDNQQRNEVSMKSDDRTMLDLKQLTMRIRTGVAKLFGSFNVERIDLHKPLIHQGMDSLIAVELRNWLAKEFVVNTPLVELLQGISVHELALFTHKKLLQRQNVSANEISTTDDSHSLLEIDTDLSGKGESNESTMSLISSLHSSTTRSPIFCIHDILGLSQTFTRFAIGLANVYGDECPPVFAFRASGFAIGEPLFQSIETIAEEYIFQMKQLQPTGPYQLLGYSFGGLVAYEMARQLQQKHRATVRSLILIDPPVPALEKLTVPDGIDKYPFWSLKTIGFIQQYLMKDKTSLAVLQDASMSEGERTRILQHLQNNVVEKINDRFSPVKKSLNRSSNNHTIAKNMCEVIQAHIIAQESYLYEAAKHSSGSFLVQRAILFTLKHHNPNVSREIKEQTWQSLIPDLIIEQLDGTHDILLEATTADIIIEQLKARTIL